MLTKLRATYGEELGTVDDVTFYSFPTVEALSAATEADLRGLGLGYRARYVVETAARVKDKGGMHWLHCLRLQSREDATAALTELTGVGPKVADCVALFSLDQHSCIPVDTHVWAIACREMDPTLREAKSITPKIYKRVGDLFRDRYGDKAGWAHCLLFIAELPAFRKLLPQRMQDSIEEFAKEERAAKALKKEAAKAKRQAKANSQAAASSSSSSSPSAVGASAVSPVKRERSATASADPASYTPKRDC